MQGSLGAVGFGVVQETPADSAHSAQARELEKLLDVSHIREQQSLARCSG